MDRMVNKTVLPKIGVGWTNVTIMRTRLSRLERPTKINHACKASKSVMLVASANLRLP